ncbi:MAG: ferredoxin [Actinomycetes bacterium]
MTEMVRVTIDLTRCEGHGICALVAPGVMDLDRYGYAVPFEGALRRVDRVQATRAAAACPRGAIDVTVDDPITSRA